jgi:hypothetical protein
LVVGGRKSGRENQQTRKQANMSLMQIAHKLISSLVCNNPRNFIAAGIENPEDGPHESPVYVWYVLALYPRKEPRRGRPGQLRNEKEIIISICEHTTVPI